MSSPRSYAWNEYLLLVTAFCPGPRYYGFLVNCLDQDEAIERILTVLAAEGRTMISFSSVDLTQGVYDTLAATMPPHLILED